MKNLPCSRPPLRAQRFRQAGGLSTCLRPPVGWAAWTPRVRQWVAGVGLACGAVGAAVAAPAQQAVPPWPGLTACSLPDLPTRAWCGVEKRPLDPAQPQGTQIDVHFAVLPALAKNKKPDPVFVFAGGPGQSALDLAGVWQRELGRFANRRDLVLVDQRGTGRSAPLKCDLDDPQRPLRESADPEAIVRQIVQCGQALQRLPHGDLRQYTTTIAMQDVDAVRQRLGAAQINIVGGSYGTRAVLEYQRQFPQAVRRAVIDGVAPPDMALPQTFAPDAQAAMDALLAACEADAACRRRFPQLRAQWQALLASLPRTVSATHPLTRRVETLTLTRDGLASLVRLPLYVPVFASALPMAIQDTSEGRFDALFGLSGSLAGAPGRGMAHGMHFSVVCAEDMPRLGQRAEAPAPDFGDGAKVYRQVCAQWPRGTVPAAFYTVPAAKTPVLVMSGSIDPVTPPRHGARVAQALGANAVHVVVPNAGHGVMGLGCLRDVVYRFVDTDAAADALKLDTGCAQALPRPPAFGAPALVAAPSAPAASAAAPTTPAASGSAR
jgi:pimeloyl-ACP methyl ester carboxylesterase